MLIASPSGPWNISSIAAMSGASTSSRTVRSASSCSRSKSGAEMVTMNKLRRHYSGRAISHLIGLHSISDHSTCKWFAIDIDLHDETVADADEVAVNNLAAAMEWSMKLRELGMDPIVFDSNGVGGYHIWTLLDREYPLEDTYNFADEMRSNWEELGLP